MQEQKFFVGDKIHKLTILKVIKGRTGYSYVCKCDCGKEVTLNQYRFTGKANAQSCGCIRHNIKNMKGQKFGRLLVLEFAEVRRRNAHWKCLCDCGKEVIVAGSRLRNGTSKSCGCLTIEASKSRGYSNAQGYSSTKLYTVWNGMKHRCEDPKSKSYRFYGQRGVSICDEWKNDFSAFRKWAYESGYVEDVFGVYTLDRIDPYGNYEPSNCRWISIAEQQRNKRKVVRIVYENKGYSVREFSETTGIPYKFVLSRYKTISGDDIVEQYKSAKKRT